MYPLAIQNGGSEQLPGADAVSVESIEEEIARLTWAVLDGQASRDERRRLAQLVEAQHTRRHT